MYKLKRNPDTKEMMDYVLNTKTNWVIPFAEDNSDYQEYLKWLAEGNEPEPADE